ncbi:CRISPR-associated protein Cas4 [Haladaptatus sp. DFWS20]|uniref:CRISPR-associated protein Cas4 n=1 Tax=Haladaptatus sp. DFWS20 TaxID=3403467 RepID=UPI003EB85083
MSKVPFSELTTAAYCPRKLYYQRRDDIEIPELVVERRQLAFEYDELLDADLTNRPIAISPAEFRSNLERVTDFDAWSVLVSPADHNRLTDGKDCRGIVHKVLDLGTPVPSMVFTGTPPEHGVWEPQSVRAVAAAKALSWEHERTVERAFVEYPVYGIVREIRLGTRRKAAYRRALRTARAIDGPRPRLKNKSKCKECEYRAECGVKTRSLRSLLGR